MLVRIRGVSARETLEAGEQFSRVIADGLIAADQVGVAVRQVDAVTVETAENL